MAQARILRIYLEPDEMRRARDGEFPFMTRIKSAFEWEGYRVEFRRASEAERLKSATRNGLSLFHMADPFHDRALNLRRAYYYPYWRIENTAARWEFDVAGKSFDPGETDTETAREWTANWRKWLFRGKAADPTRGGFVYVPLQGRLLERRSFQAAAPIDMLGEALARAPDRDVLATLHPGETYSAKELRALEELAEAEPRLRVKTGGMEDALATCDYVVTENSSAALSGFFFGKPAILFAKIDFHHIALNVAEIGVERAFDEVEIHAPDYDAYLYWFIHLNAIKADADDAGDKIIARIKALGWLAD